MLDPALVKEADDKLATACVAVAKLAEAATREEKQAINDIIYAVTEASRMLMELVGHQPGAGERTPLMPNKKRSGPQRTDRLAAVLA
jgi:hypothetical protein